MVDGPRLAGVIVTALVLILSLTHLGLGIGVLVELTDYGNIFRPENGIAGYNIFVGCFGIIVSGFGLFSVLTDRGILGSIVAYVSIALCIFAVGSLIAATVINAQAVGYTRSRFSSIMNEYPSNNNAKDTTNRVQRDFSCCGTDTWLDWTTVSLNGATTTTSTTTTTATSAVTTTVLTTVVVTSQTSAAPTTAAPTTAAPTTAAPTTAAPATAAPTTAAPATAAPTTVVVTTAVPATPAPTTAAATAAPATPAPTAPAPTAAAPTTVAARAMDPFNNQIESISSVNDREQKSILNVGIEKYHKNHITDQNEGVVASWNFRSLEEKTLKFLGNFTSPIISMPNFFQERQIFLSKLGLYQFPFPITVTVPLTCCGNVQLSIEDLRNRTCNITTGGSSTHYTNGCAVKLGEQAVGFSVGFVVINAVLAVLALATFPILLALYDPADYEDYDARPGMPMNQTAMYAPHPQSYGMYGGTLGSNISNIYPVQYIR